MPLEKMEIMTKVSDYREKCKDGAFLVESSCQKKDNRKLGFIPCYPKRDHKVGFYNVLGKERNAVIEEKLN